MPYRVCQHSPAREYLQEQGNDCLQQRVELIAGGDSGLDEDCCTIGAVRMHPVQQQALQGLTTYLKLMSCARNEYDA